MKKMIVTLFVIFVMILSLNVYADEIYDISIEMQIGQNQSIVNGTVTDIDENKYVVPFIENGRTLVPLRFVADNLGLDVEWVEDTQSVILTNSDIKIILIIGKYEASFNGVDYELESCPVVENQRTFVPVRFIGEALQCDVSWDEDNQKVFIKREKEVELDINDAEVQKLFQDVLNKKEFASYYTGYCDIALLDNSMNIFGGTTRELFAILDFEQFEEKKYTKNEAKKVILDFLSKGDTSQSLTNPGIDSLRSRLEQGADFGSNSKEEILVAVYDGKVFDNISIDLFGEPLPKHENLAYSVGYYCVHLNNSVNLYYPYAKTNHYNVYYNEASHRYLFTKYAEKFLDFGYDEKYELDGKLVKATRHNGKISLYIQRCSSLDEHSGEKSRYDGVCKNTYKKGDDGYYWVSSFGMGNIAYINEAVLKNVEKNALKYINETYPDFTVENIAAKYMWYENEYEVEYDDGKGDSRTVVFDHTGENVSTDIYIYYKGQEIVLAYESETEQKVESILQNTLGEKAIDYIIIYDKKAYGKEREIVLNGLDISNDPVSCTIGLVGNDDATTLEFAKVCKQVYIDVSSAGLPIEEIKIVQQNSPESRFDIVCPANMGEMSIDEIEKLIGK